MTSFINGGAPNYLGAVAESIPQTLTLLRDLMVSEGWTLESGDFDTYPMILSSQEVRNGVKAWLQYNVIGTSILWSGRIDGVAGALSLEITTNSVAISTGGRLWASCDGGRIGWWHRQNNSGLAVYGGFLSEAPIGDGYGWVVGHANNIATSTASGSYWAMAKRSVLLSNWYNLNNIVSGFYITGLEPSITPDNLIDGQTRIVPYYKVINGDCFRGFADLFTPSFNGKTVATWHNIQNNVYIVTDRSALLIDQVITP